MGGLASRGGEGLDDFLATVDVGPPQMAFLPEGSVYSLESASMPGHFVRHRSSELWVDRKGDEVSELYAFDASFVLVNGLVGRACSFRSTNFPLEFVRRRDSKMFIAEYDGSEDMRSDATFELRAAEVDMEAGAFESSCSGARPDSGTSGLMVCLMLAECPGKYLCVDKDNRLVVDTYDHLKRSAFSFRASPGFALKWSEDLGEPLLYEDSRGCGNDILASQGWDAACAAAQSLMNRGSLAAQPGASTIGRDPPKQDATVAGEVLLDVSARSPLRDGSLQPRQASGSNLAQADF